MITLLTMIESRVYIIHKEWNLTKNFFIAMHAYSYILCQKYIIELQTWTNYSEFNNADTIMQQRIR